MNLKNFIQLSTTTYPTVQVLLISSEKKKLYCSKIFIQRSIMVDDGEFFALYVWKLPVNRLKKPLSTNCVGSYLVLNGRTMGRNGPTSTKVSQTLSSGHLHF